MFSRQESQFIRALARDYSVDETKADSLILKNSGSRISQDPSIPKTGIDYSRFEKLVAKLDEEEARVITRPAPSNRACTVDHGHSHNCSGSCMGCAHDHSHERRIFDKSTQEKLKAIRLFRTEGNEHFKMKSYNEALLSYKRAMLYLDYSFAETDTEDEELDMERLKCHNNLAAVYIEMQKFDEVINHSRLALRIDPDCVKAYYRMGLAHLKRAELDEAQSNLYAALKRGSAQGRDTIKVIEVAIRDLNMKQREYRQRSSAVAKAAFQS